MASLRKACFVVPVPQGDSLLGAGLLLGNQQRRLGSREDRDVFPSDLAESTRDACALLRFTCHRRYTEKLASGMRKKICQTHGVIDVRTDVCVEQYLGRHRLNQMAPSSDP